MSLSLSPLSTSSSGSANKQQQSANKNKKLATNLPRFWLSTFSQEGQPQNGVESRSDNFLRFCIFRASFWSSYSL